MSDNLVTFIAHFTDGPSRYIQVERPANCHPRDRKLYVMALDDAESDGSTVDRIAIPWHIDGRTLDARTRTRREIEQRRFRFG